MELTENIKRPQRPRRPAPKRVKLEPQELTPDGGYVVKTYYPTMEEMKDFSAYVKKIHDDGGNRAGLAKIKPPPEFKARRAPYDDEEIYKMNIQYPIKQIINGQLGRYSVHNMIIKENISVRNFKKMADQKQPTPVHDSYSDLDRKYWKQLFTNPSVYGADVPASLFDDDVNEFNPARLNTILDDVTKDYNIKIEGVNTCYLYFGMWKSTFAWHTEDMDLYSINYLHFGEPKSWYVVPPEHGKRFERLAQSYFPNEFKECKAFLRHKRTIISPKVLRNNCIPFSKVTQEAGEFMITFPFAYHSGYNHGYNIAEATNFALDYWIDFGKWATLCNCRSSADMVRISMKMYVYRYQPDRYEKWKNGEEICEDPRDKRIATAPKPDIIYEDPLYEEENTTLTVKTKAARKEYPTESQVIDSSKDNMIESYEYESAMATPPLPPATPATSPQPPASPATSPQPPATPATSPQSPADLATSPQPPADIATSPQPLATPATSPQLPTTPATPATPATPPDSSSTHSLHSSSSPPATQEAPPNDELDYITTNSTNSNLYQQ